MKKEDIYRLMAESSPMTVETLLDLREIIKKYPFFQVAKILYLRNLANLNENNFVSELERLVISLPDRKHLFRLLKGGEYNLNISLREREKEPMSGSFSLIDAFLSDKDEVSQEIGDSSVLFQPSVSSDYMFWSLSSGNDKKESQQKLIHQLHHHDLIDSFIENDQQRIPGRGFEIDKENGELETPESVKKLDDELGNPLEDSCLTETLARIYIKQKRYDKALQIIKNLSLKYPEKNVYFADQIRFLEKLIINTKK